MQFGRLCYVGPCYHDMVSPEMAYGEDNLKIFRVFANILRSSRQPARGGPPASGLERGLINSPQERSKMVPKQRGNFGIHRRRWDVTIKIDLNPLNTELNPICQ